MPHNAAGWRPGNCATQPPPEPQAVHNCWGLLLAAGFGRRFGADKRLQTLPGGESVAQTSVENWLAACTPDKAGTRLSHLYVVTRPDDDLARQLGNWVAGKPNAPLSLLSAPEADQGMGHTLASATRQIPAGALLIGLADMPWVQPASLYAIVGRVLGSDDPGVIVQPSYRGQPGNPLGFGPAQRAALSQTSGDQGARALVRDARLHDTLIQLDINDEGILRDVDTPADLLAAPASAEPPRN